MSDTTPRLGLPLLAAGQAQKEIFHNEALVLLEAAAIATVEAVGVDVPPTAPAAGQCWIVGMVPSGDWTGHALALAVAIEGGWRFMVPPQGLTVRRAGDGIEVRFDGAAWRIGELAVATVRIGGVQVVGMQQSAVAAPAGGTVVDSEARAAIEAVLHALRAHGLVAP